MGYSQPKKPFDLKDFLSKTHVNKPFRRRFYPAPPRGSHVQPSGTSPTAEAVAEAVTVIAGDGLPLTVLFGTTVLLGERVRVATLRHGRGCSRRA